MRLQLTAVDRSVKQQIIFKDEQIAEKLKLEDCIDVPAKRSLFISIKHSQVQFQQEDYETLTSPKLNFFRP